MDENYSADNYRHGWSATLEASAAEAVWRHTLQKNAPFHYKVDAEWQVASGRRWYYHATIGAANRLYIARTGRQWHIFDADKLPHWNEVSESDIPAASVCGPFTTLKAAKAAFLIVGEG